MLPVCHLQGEATENAYEKIVVTNPLELVNIDYLCLHPRKGKEENALVVIDHYTWYKQA